MGAASDVDEDAVAAVGRGPRAPAAAPFGEAAQRAGIARRIGVEDGKAGAIGLRVGERQAGRDAARGSRRVDGDDEPPVAGRGGGDEGARRSSSPLPSPLSLPLSPSGRGWVRGSRRARHCAAENPSPRPSPRGEREN